MTLNIKKSGAYSAAAGVFVKKSGIYSAVQGMFVKVAGVYQNVLNYLAANAVFDWSYLSGSVGPVDASTGSASFWLRSNLTISSYRTIFKFGRCIIGINDTGFVYLTIVDSTTLKTFSIGAPVAVTGGGVNHYAFEWDTTAGAGSKIGHLYVNGVLVAANITDSSVGFVGNYNGAAYVGASAAGANWAYVDIGELMFWPGTFANWATNIGKVYAGGLPVDPGSNGSKPLGVVPNIYLSVRGSALADTFVNNIGSGLTFTKTGFTLQRADEGLISYGDSLTYGTGASYTGTYWTTLVAHGLNRPIKQYNFGIGGLTIQGSPGIADNMVNASNIYGVLTAAQSVTATKDRKWTLEGGYNSVANGASVIVAAAQSMVSAMLAADPNAKWVFIGIPTGDVGTDGITAGGGVRHNTITSVNSQLATLFGANFLDINAYLIANGIAVSSPPSAPTAQDLLDIAGGVVPTSLRTSGQVHWNDYGHLAVSIAVLAKMTALGYN